jgi:hypothetical protein
MTNKKQVSTLASHWLEDCADLTPTPEGNDKYKQQANPLLSMHNYTQLVISGKNKNKQLTLLSQCKLALTGRNMFMAL